jgi:D-glycero-D-manno-heptose 1,7-bisphosphate phosphatase
MSTQTNRSGPPLHLPFSAWGGAHDALDALDALDPPAVRPELLLCDRDGTIVVDVPYNDDPALVRPLPGVADALAAARRAGMRTAIVTNQSGIARGLITPERLEAVHARIQELLGPFDAIVHCPHDDGDGCACRKPMPGLVERAADLLGVPTSACVLIGDTRADVSAAYGAGAIGMLVPNDRTLPLEVRGVAHVHGDFADAVDRVLDWRRGHGMTAVREGHGMTAVGEVTA